MSNKNSTGSVVREIRRQTHKKDSSEEQFTLSLTDVY